MATFSKSNIFGCMLAAWTVLISAVEATTSNVLKIAVLQPMTTGQHNPDECGSEFVNGSCYYGDEFRAMSACGILAAKDFNERVATYVPEFGTLSNCDLQIELEVFDAPPNSRREAVSSLLNLLDTFEPHAVIGASSSGNSKPTSIITGVFDIPQISYWATSKQLDNTGNYPRFMRTIPTDDAVAFSVCNFWKSLGYEYAGVFYINDAYGEAFKESTIKHCKEMGFQNVISFPFDASETEEVTRAQVKKLADTGVKVFLYVDYSDKTKDIMTAANDFGILGEGNMWIFGESVYTADISNLAPEIRQNVDGAIRIYAPGGVDSNPRWLKFKENWKSNDVEYFNNFWPEPFEASTTFFQDFNPAAMEVQVPGVYQYDAIASVALAACEIAPQGPIPSDFGTKFWEIKENLVFDGVTGSVKFDIVGNRDKNTANYEMSNIRAPATSSSVNVNLVATFNVDTLEWEYLSNAQIVFNGGTTEVPPNVEIPEEDTKWDGNIRTFCLILCCVNIGTAAIFLLWTLTHRNTQIVKASQVHFLAMVSIGAMISSLTIYPITIDDEIGPKADENGGNDAASIACNASIWLYCIGFVLTFAPLFAKTWRVKKIFNIGKSNKLRRTNIPTSLLIGIVAGLLFVELSIVALWTITDPLEYVRKTLVEDQFGNPLESSGSCVGENSTTYILILVILHISVLIYGNYLCYQCRGINSAFAESKYVSIAMFSNLQVLALGIPVLIIVADNPKSNMFIRAGMIFLNDFTVQILIFLPKVMHVHFGFHMSGGEGSEFVQKAATTTFGTRSRSSFVGSKRSANRVEPSVAPSSAAAPA